MSLALSSITIYPLSSSFITESIDFINSDRDLNYIELSSSLSGFNIKYPEFTKYINNIWIDKDYHLFLTSNSKLSCYFNSLKTLSSDIYGYNMSQFNVKYDWIINNFSTNFSYNNDTQFLGIIDNNLKINLCPLKTKTSIDNDQYSLQNNYREYQKIYNFEKELFLQYKINKIPFKVNPDEYNYIFNSYNIASCYINDTEFVSNGAIGGNCPLNSDIIFFEQNEYGDYTNNGIDNINNINNGTLLCLWLSSENVSISSNKIWAERWYDPNTVSQGDALITQKNTLSSSFSYIKDIPSYKILSDKEKFIYLRYGEKRNNTFINSLSSNLVLEIKDWSKNFKSTVNNISGYIIGQYNNKTDSFILDGSIHAYIPSIDNLFTNYNFSISLWANCDNWLNNNDSQFLGNYNNNNGYGIFYNTGTPDNLLTIPSRYNNLISLNNKGFKVFEKDIKQDLGLSSIDITYVKTDLFGNRWLFDDYNKNLYKLENDDILIKTINLPENCQIQKLDCDSNNNLFVLDSFNNNISSFNSYGEVLSSVTTIEGTKTFCIKNDDSLIYSFSDFMDVNSKNDIISINGGSVLCNGEKILHLKTLPQCFRIDHDDNMWFLVNKSLYKLNSTGSVLIEKELPILLDDEDAEMCFIKTYKNNKEHIFLWIVLNKQKKLLIINENGIIIKNLNLNDFFIGDYCRTFELSVKGDFSGFDNKRKFETYNNKPISPDNPCISVKLNTKYKNTNKIIQLHTSCKDMYSWSHISFTVRYTNNNTIIKMYVNGILKTQKILSGIYIIDYMYKASPFVIGGNSGKLGAKNLEKSIIREGYFKGEIDDVRIYNKTLNDFEIFHLSLNNYFHKWKPINMYINCPETTFFEEIDNFYINRYKGFKSNYYNIVIKNFSSNKDLQNIIKDYILKNISDFVPVNTMLKDIIFE